MDQAIAIVGGTGAEGAALAARLAKAGARVLVGSRNPEKAVAVASRIHHLGIGGEITGHSNSDATSLAKVVILTVPLSAQVETLKSIRERLVHDAILVDTTVPLEIAVGGRLSRLITLWDGSAAQQAARLAPPGTSVVAAFHGLSADSLARLDERVDCDALLCGDNARSKQVVSEIAEMIPGVRAIDAGSLENARYLETAAAMLIALNLQHKVKHSGIRITGLQNRVQSGRE